MIAIRDSAQIRQSTFAIAEVTTRSEIAERARIPSIVRDEDSHSLKHDLDTPGSWADALAKTSLSRAKKCRKVESHENEGDQLGKHRLAPSDVGVSNIQ